MAASRGAGSTEAARTYLEQTPSQRRQYDVGTSEKLFQLPLEAVASLTSPLNGKVAKAIVSDLESAECAWSSATRLSASGVLKELSRSASASRVLSGEEQLQQMTSICTQLKGGQLLAADATEERLQHLDLILRSLSNVLFQHENARQSFAQARGSFQLALRLMDKMELPNLIFLSARLIFFATLKPTAVLKGAVQDFELVDIFADRLLYLLQAPRLPETEMAITELLKAFFNVGLYYPKLVDNQNTQGAVVGEAFNDALLPFLVPAIRVIMVSQAHNDAVLVSPITNAIAVLLNFPVKGYEDVWMEGDILYSLPRSRGNSNKRNSDERDRRSSSSSGTSTKTGASDRAATSLPLQNNSAAVSSLKRASQFFRKPFSTPMRKNTDHRRASADSDGNVVRKLLSILTQFCQRFFGSASDIDGGNASRLAKRDGIDLEVAGEPILLLLRKLADESDGFRKTIKDHIIPPNVDRSEGLDKRTDLTGILVRLMSSNDFPKLARGSGEVLLAMCDGQATQMTAMIGYGPCAGFLNNVGLGHALPGCGANSGKDGEQRPIDPITGKSLPTEEEIARQDAESGLAAMSMEEKEAEAEKLFSLFDRMNRTGVMSVVDPRRQAVESGRIRELEDEQEREELEAQKRQGDADEEEAEREMQAFRRRQQKSVAREV